MENVVEGTSVNLDEGKGIEINCGASGKPEPTVKWYAFKYADSNSVFLKCNFILELIIFAMQGVIFVLS